MGIKDIFQKKKSNVLTVNKQNYKFLKQIVSQSGLTFNKMYYINMNKYRTCLHIVELPKEETNCRGLFNYLKGIPNTLVTFDFERKTRIEFEAQVGKYLDNKSNTVDVSREKKKNPFVSKNESWEVQDINQFHSALKYHDDMIEVFTIRVYLEAATYEELVQKVEEVLQAMEQQYMFGCIQTNNLQADVQALTTFDNPVKAITSTETMSEFLLDSTINRVDENSYLVGKTVNGLFAPNHFSFRNNSHNALFIGDPNCGKSTFMDLLGEAQYVKGNTTYQGVDVEGTQGEKAKRWGIPYVSLSEKQFINLGQIYFVENDEWLITSTEIANKVSEFMAIFRMLTKFTREETYLSLSTIISEMYSKRYENKKLSDFENVDWFTFGDVLQIVEDKYRHDSDLTEQEKTDYYSLEIGLKSIVGSYGHLLNKHTNINFDLMKSAIFDTSFVKNNNDVKFKATYFYLLLGYFMKGAYLNKKRNDEYIKEHNISLYTLTEPVFKYVLDFDEARQIFIDEGLVIAATSLLKFVRKAYGGANFAFHTKKDFEVFLGKTENPLQEIFDLCTNLYVGKTSIETLTALQEMRPQITDRDKNKILQFKKGENGERQFYCYDDSGNKMVIYPIVTPYQREYMGSGK